MIFGGLASGDPSYVTNVIHANSGKIHADGLGVHPYGRRPYDDWPSSSWGFGPLIPFLQDYYAVAKLPIWITEVGTNDMKVQDQFPNKTFSSINEQFAIQSPYVFWFCWSDGMVSPFGVVNVNGKKKPSYDSYKQFASLPWKTN